VNGYVVHSNEGARILQGYTQEEMVGLHFSQFYTTAAKAVGHPERELAAAAAFGRYEEDGWRVRKDNSRFWAHVGISALFDESNVLRGYAEILRDDTDQKQAQEECASVMKLLDLTASTDHLTGLHNRRSFDKELTLAVSSAQQRRGPISLAMIDLDHFKAYNDAFGHSSGDVYLKQATSTWRKTLRPTDFIARYGGEEFIVMLRDTDMNEAIACMERLRLATPGTLTCSIGVAQWQSTEPLVSLMGRADRALYKAKSSGRNCVAFDADSILSLAAQLDPPNALLNRSSAC